MTNWIGLLALVLNLALVLRRPRLGVLVFVALAMLLPHASIGGVVVAYEIFALPLILVGALIKRPRLVHGRLHLLLALFLVLIILSTIVGTTAHGTEFDAIRFQGIVRFLVLLALCREMLSREDVERVLLIVVGVNAAVGLVQLVLPGMAQMFFGFYGRAGQVVLERYALEDAIPRATGTFSSPVTLGSVALLAVAVAWARLLARGGTARHRWLLMLAAVAGIVSLTKTFLLGVPLVLLGGLVLSPIAAGTARWRLRPRTVVYGVGALLLAGGISYGIGDYLSRSGFYVGYYLAYLTNPEASLATRYGPGGQLAETMAVIRDNPLIGVGVTKVQGEFLGDSTFVVLLHATGIVGVTVASVALLLIVRRIVRLRRHLDLLVVGALLVAGLAAPFILSLPGALGIVYVLGRSPRPAIFERRDSHRAPLPGRTAPI